MTRLPNRPYSGLRPTFLLLAPLLLAALSAAPLGAQGQPGTFTLPPPTPTPTPAPAGPADERAGVAIPPRAQPTARPTAQPTATPQPTTPRPTASPAPAPTASPRALATPILPPPPARESAPPALPAPDAGSADTAPAPAASGDATALPPGPGLPLPGTAPAATEAPGQTAPQTASGWPAADGLWLWLAGGLGALALLGGGWLWRRRRKARPLRLAPAPGTGGSAGGPDRADGEEQPRIDLTLDIISATRSVMMFTVEYRLTIANRSERAVTDVTAAVQLACARASAAGGGSGGGAASPGAAQSLAGIARVGPQQARSLTGTVQLPLSAIAPLRQGTAPLFIPLVHVTLEAEGLRALTRSFVIGTPSGSGSGRVHPILLDQPPGAIAGLVAQGVTIPPASSPA